MAEFTELAIGVYPYSRFAAVNTTSDSQTAVRTVLVVDDQQAVRETLNFVLTSGGYKVVEADSAHAALILAASEAIDAALIDVHMPRMSGIEACVQLRAQTEQRGRPPIRMWLMTGAGNKDLERRAVECGAFGLLRKPFELSNLYETLKRGFASPIPTVAPSPAVPAAPRDCDLRYSAAGR